MHVNISKKCIGCGVCTDICPSMFQLSAKCYANVSNHKVSIEDISNVNEAVQKCPVFAITLQD